MSNTIFYSWQANHSSSFNRNFIQDCIEKAIKQVKKEIGDQSGEVYLDRGIGDVPGTPNIPSVIIEKIRESDIFIADETFVTYIEKPNPYRSWIDKFFGLNKWIKEGVPNPNVTSEIGTAKGDYRGNERIIKVMNIKFGKPTDLFFDSVQDRFAITYKLDKKTSEEQKKKVKKKLIDELKYAIGLVIKTEPERQKKYYLPFDTWGTWASQIDRTTLKFELTHFIKEIFSTIDDGINEAKTIFRMNGLSGIGKTRVLFEYFVNQNTGDPKILANKLLYIDVNDSKDEDIKQKVKELVSAKENKILIVDNCTKDLHSDLRKYVTNENSSLSLISVGGDPEEKINEIDENPVTKLIRYDNEKNKDTVAQILANKFADELSADEQKLLIDFSSGLPLIATLMATNEEREPYQPGTLTIDRIVRRLLGRFYTDKTYKAVVHACCLFSKFGFADDLLYQLQEIAGNDDLFSVRPENIKDEDLGEWRKQTFKQVCMALHERQLLEKRGRTYAFRPSPLAVRMAEDWWRDCTIGKFHRLLPFLTQNNLIEPFCEQFRYLRHVENAREIVKGLCDGFFSSAEVLNTNVGSRLFRSFVYVNPVACTSALLRAFSGLSKEEIANIKEGRRNLVWSLEKLCYNKETFYQASHALAILATGENENLGNNATNQFVQLFHIYLPGTKANLEARWEIIQYCLSKNDDFKSLAIGALSSSLVGDHFHRMGGAEDIGYDNTTSNGPGDYSPDAKEISVYWKNSINELKQFALHPGDFQTRALGILKDKFYSLCSFGFGKEIIPVIEQLLNAGLYDRMELRAKVEFILNSQRVYDRHAIVELERIYSELSPTGFFEQFQTLVKSPTFEEYKDDEFSNSHGAKLHKKIEQLAKTFLGLRGQWDELFQIFLTPSLAEGYTFGKFLSLHANESDLKTFIDYFIENLPNIPADERNASILIGILANNKNIEFVKSIFYVVLKNPLINELAFLIARSTQLSFDEINELLKLTKNAVFSTGRFKEFNYGWGLNHLSPNQVEDVIIKLSSIDDLGKAISFFILATWTVNNESEFNSHKVIIRKILLEDSNAIFKHLTDSMDIHYYEKVLIKLLTQKADEDLAKMAVHLIVEESNELRYFYAKDSSFYNILNVLQEKYFQILWEAITKVYVNLETYGISAWHFKSLLGSKHDFSNQTPGILFGGNPEKFEIIFNWCKQHRGRELLWITELLPIFDLQRSETNDWHPYAINFINEFGGDTHFLGALFAKINTYSWSGSIIPKLNSDIALFQRILNHPIPTVREWAQAAIDDIRKRIKFEYDRDEEGF